MDMKSQSQAILSLGLGALCFAAAIETGAQTPAAPQPLVQQQAKLSPKERCDALKARLAAEAYDWHVYAQIGDALMEMGRPREAAAAYEKAIAIYPLSKERSSEMRQAEFIAAQASAEETRQKIAKEAAERQANEAAMAATMQTLSLLPGASSAGAIHAQQAASAAAAMTQGLSQADAAAAAGRAAGIANPIQQVNFSLPERQETAGLWIKLGRAYDAYGDHDRAGAAFEQGSSMDPARFDALYLTGLCLYSSGQREKSLLAANRYLSLAPGDPPVSLCLLLGDSLRGLGLEREAVAAYSAASQTLAKGQAAKPSDPGALISAGGVQVKAGNYSAALDCFRRANALNPSLTGPLSGMIICQISLGDQAGLRETASQLKAKASSIEDWYALARANDALGDDAGAALCYSKCVSLWDSANPNPSGLQPGLIAFARAGAGAPEQAVALLKERLFKESFAQDAFLDFHRLGLAYLKGKEPRPELAACAFRLALEENPSFAQAAIELKNLCAKSSAETERLIAESGKAQDRNSAAPLLGKAWALMPDGPQRDAVLQAMAASLLAPISEEAEKAWFRANSCLSLKKGLPDVKRAVFEFRQAQFLAPWSPTLPANLAACHSALGRNDLAIAEIEMSMALSRKRGSDDVAKKFDYEGLLERSAREARELTPFK